MRLPYGNYEKWKVSLNFIAEFVQLVLKLNSQTSKGNDTESNFFIINYQIIDFNLNNFTDKADFKN